MRRVMLRAQVWVHDDEVIEVRWSTAERRRPAAKAGSAGASAHGRQHSLRVCKILDDWDHIGRWWLDGYRRRYFLLEAEDGRVAEVYRESSLPREADPPETDGAPPKVEEGGSWWLSRISD